MRRATVSGSFHRHLTAISQAVQELTDRGVMVMSPADPRIVDAAGEFMFVASDRVRSVRLVQDRHLQSVAASDFLWLVCPDGYVGQSASMEIGFAVGQGVPILSATMPSDLTIRQYVHVVTGVAAAIECTTRSTFDERPTAILIDPHDTVERAHAILERLDTHLTSRFTGDSVPIYADARKIAGMLLTPGSLRAGSGVRGR